MGRLAHTAAPRRLVSRDDPNPAIRTRHGQESPYPEWIAPSLRWIPVGQDGYPEACGPKRDLVMIWHSFI